MNITQKRYKILADYERVYRFLTDTYDRETLNSCLLPQYFEYAHCHPGFDYHMAHRNGVWEDGGRIAGVACYEMRLGEGHLHTRKGYEFLLPELLAWAEKELPAVKDGKRSLKIWITDREPGKRELLRENRYVLAGTDPIKIFDYKNPFTERKLPEGFSLIDGASVDGIKLNACWWRGFDHGDDPGDDPDCQICSAPRFDPSLMTIAVAPDGEYACALGMWFDAQNEYAYLEPLATPPKYRRMGLATVCLTEAMKKTKALGARYCFGGGREFYTAVGFEHVCSREQWKKEW